MLDEKRVPIIIKKEYKNQKDEIELLKKYSKLLVCEKRTKGIETAIQKKFDTIKLYNSGNKKFEALVKNLVE